MLLNEGRFLRLACHLLAELVVNLLGESLLRLRSRMRADCLMSRLGHAESERLLARLELARIVEVLGLRRLSVQVVLELRGLLGLPELEMQACRRGRADVRLAVLRLMQLLGLRR